MTPTSALLRFYIGAGARLAMRAGLPAAALLTVAIGLSGSADAVLRWAAADLGSGALATPLVLTALSFGIAAWCAPRIGLGASGWIRHLPASAASHGRGQVGAMMVAQAPVAVAWAMLWVLALGMGEAVDPRRLVALPVVLAGIGCALLPARGAWLFGLAGVTAVGLALSGGWIGIAVGAGIVVAATSRFQPVARDAGSFRFPVKGIAGRGIPGRIASRAVGWRVLGAWVPALLLFGVAALIVENNPEFDTSKPLRLVGTLAIGSVVASLADALAARRPPWRWARSLPWSAADRVGHDARWLGLRAGVVPVAFALLDPMAAAAVALALPLLAVRGAGLLRRKDGTMGNHTRVVVEGFFLGLALLLSPWVGGLALALTWPAARDAARRDRDLDVSRWSPRTHLAVGDPGSWRGG